MLLYYWNLVGCLKNARGDRERENILQEGHMMVTLHFMKLESLPNLPPGNHTAQKLQRNAGPTVSKFNNFKGLHENLSSELNSLMYKFKFKSSKVMTLRTLSISVHVYTPPICS